MRQVLYVRGEGSVLVAEVPTPQTAPGRVLVRTAASLISAGTEKMVLEFARKSLAGKARSRPDLVPQVLGKARRDGWLAAFRAVRDRLDRPIALGYSSAGTILEVGEGMTDFKPGDRVACAGTGFAMHAEIVSVPRNLIARIPQPRPSRIDPIDFEEAAFAALGAIALHGLRLAEPQIGETVAVIGLGAVGLLAAQLARAAGCVVLGTDPDRTRCQIAERLRCAACAGESEFASLVAARTESTGVDAVILAAATPSQGPVRLAGKVARRRGRVIAVGAVGTNVPRNVYFEKELDFRISRSYGPGRYDREYERKGLDYPIEYVRWTENRNLKSFLDLLAEGRIDVLPLVTHRFAISEATRAYDLILGGASEEHLAVVLTYNDRPAPSSRREPGIAARCAGESGTGECPRVGVLGAGNFALGVLIPAIRRAARARLVGICAASGASAQYAAKKFGFEYSTTDPLRIFEDPGIDTVVIATPNVLHASQVLAAVAARKSVFCEKPLCVSETELAGIVRAYAGGEDPKPLLTVGFNRRFSPMAKSLKETLAGRTDRPLMMQYRVNAGPAPAGDWMEDREQGGRILGEVCHFVDLMGFLAGTTPVRVYARRPANNGDERDDSALVFLEFADGSMGTIAYAANGEPSFPKERLEVFGGGGAGVIDDFRRLELASGGRRKTAVWRLRQDKGHRAEWQEFFAALQNGQPPIPFQEIVATMLATLRIPQSLSRGRPVELGLQEFAASSLESAGEKRPEQPAFDEVQSSRHP